MRFGTEYLVESLTWALMGAAIGWTVRRILDVVDEIRRSR